MNPSEINILGLDTSGKSASCAIMSGGIIVAETTFLTKLTHSQIILPTMLRTIDDAGLSLSDIDLFAVSSGPGSYTGLRIGIAAVKGLCALGKPCIGVSTLEAAAYNAAQKGLIIPAIYARPGVYYFGAYIFDGVKMSTYSEDKVGDESGIKALADGYEGDIVICGSHAEKIKTELFNDRDNVRPALSNQCMMSASGICLAAKNHISEAGPAENLRARYLQNTMAEKLKDREKR